MKNKKKILVLGAMPSEVILFKKMLNSTADTLHHGFPYFTSALHKHNIAVAVTGVGVTNSSIATTLFIEKFKPTHVIFTGSGARLNPALRTGDTIIVRKSYHHNAGSLTEDGMVYRKVRGPSKGTMTSYVFNADNELLACAKMAAKDFAENNLTVNGVQYAPKIKVGSVCSSDLFGVNKAKIDDMRKKLNCDLMDMESAAVAQTCQQLGVPHLIIRSGSNLVQPNPGNDYKRLGQIAAHQAARFTLHLLAKTLINL